MTAKREMAAAATSFACVNLQMLRASHYIMKVYDEAYRPLGIRATQMPVLGAVARLAPASIKRLAQETESERSVIHRRLQVMQKNGWVKEDPATSGKEKTFVLTDKGRKLIEKVSPLRAGIQEKIFAALSNDERQLLLSLCNKLKSASLV